MNNKTNLTSSPLLGGLEGGLRIKIERNILNDDCTLGMLRVEDIIIGSTIEPVHITKAKPNDLCAIPEGEYKVKVNCNPLDGCPNIKIYGKNIPSNISLRSIRPISNKNASIAFWNEEKDIKANMRKWADLLNYLMEAGGEATLLITNY